VNPAATQPDWIVYVGESEGSPLVVKLDRRFGAGYFDPKRQWAVMMVVRLPRVDGNGLPPADDFPLLDRFETELVQQVASDPDDWVYVVRVMGEGVCRLCFYSPRSGGVAKRIERTLAEISGLDDFTPHCTVQVLQDPKWEAYGRFFADASDDLGGVAPSFRDESALPGSSVPPRPRRPQRDEQPWRGEETQTHPDD
jgi:hypothetical protein